MHLPEDLKANLQSLLSTIPRNALAAASDELSKRYRSPDRDQHQIFMTTDAHRLAYLAVRFPATYAVIRRVLLETHQRMPAFSPKSICDVGAGPGTAAWAALEVFPEIAQAVLHEKDIGLIELGKRLMQKSAHLTLRSAEWKQCDLAQGITLTSHDLVVLSYVIGELPLERLKELIKLSWEATAQVLVVIEPGTPHGFARIRAVRQQLIDEGAFLVAPCPHQKACPMPPGDWCHFAERLERSDIHMAVKEVEVGYEDEKYSYVVAAKRPVILPETRVLRHPKRHSGHVELFLCGQEGLEKKTISRRHGDAYKKARKIEWGDTWDKE